MRSLLSYVEEHAERLRAAYLAWLHELGESLVQDRRLVDHLALEEGLSYWWMTPFIEKSTVKSPIGAALRLLALEELVAKHRPCKLTLQSADGELDACLRPWSKELALDYAWQPVAPLRRPSLRAAMEALPHALLAVASLSRYALRRWPMRQAKGKPWSAGNESVFICSYLFNFDTARAQQGGFHSRYWDGLHCLLQEMGVRANWLQVFVAHEAVPDAAAANAFIEGFNVQNQGPDTHAMLDTYLSWPVLVKVLRGWLGLRRRARGLTGIEQAFARGPGKISFWPLMRYEWANAMRGRLAVSNLMSLALFDAAMADLPRQRQGLYLCENQPWERALCHAWRKHGHGRLVAVPHSTVRFWDMRYFADTRSMSSLSTCPMPLAELHALNGRAAVDAYLQAGFPAQRIAEVEALRYDHLRAARPRQAEKRQGDSRVLLLGDYSPVATAQMLTMLEQALLHLSVPMRFTLKPHPACPIRVDQYPSLRLEVLTGSLAGMLADFDVAVAGNATSAAVDACFSGLSVIVILDPQDLNLSPLRGQRGVRFAGTSTALAAALQTKDLTACAQAADTFFLAPGLPRWRALLGARSPAVPSV